MFQWRDNLLRNYAIKNIPFFVLTFLRFSMITIDKRRVEIKETHLAREEVETKPRVVFLRMFIYLFERIDRIESVNRRFA